MGGAVAGLVNDSEIPVRRGADHGDNLERVAADGLVARGGGGLWQGLNQLGVRSG